MLEQLKKLVKTYKDKKTDFANIERREFVHSSIDPVRPLKIIVICNQKGGCGKTTTAINLGAGLAKKGFSVLLLDLDPQAHSSLGLDIEVDNLRRTIYDCLIHNVELDKIIIPTSINNLFLAPANHLLSGAQLELANLVGRESILKMGLNKLSLIKQYDYYLIDTSPTLNLVTLNGLVAASKVLIPIQTHYYSLEGMRELFSTIDLVQERLNPQLQILGILPTLFDGRLKVNKEILVEIQEYFGDLLLKSIIHYNCKVVEAARFKKPVVNYAPDSRGAKEYINLAEELDFILGGDSSPVTASEHIRHCEELTK